MEFLRQLLNNSNKLLNGLNQLTDTAQSLLHKKVLSQDVAFGDHWQDYFIILVLILVAIIPLIFAIPAQGNKAHVFCTRIMSYFCCANPNNEHKRHRLLVLCALLSVTFALLVWFFGENFFNSQKMPDLVMTILFSLPIVWVLWIWRNNDKLRSMGQTEKQLEIAEKNLLLANRDCDNKNLVDYMHRAANETNPAIQVAALQGLKPYLSGAKGVDFQEQAWAFLTAYTNSFYAKTDHKDLNREENPIFNVLESIFNLAFKNDWFIREKISNMNFSYMRFDSISINYKLQSCDFSHAIFFEVSAKKNNFMNCKFTTAQFIACTFSECFFFQGCDFSYTKFSALSIFTSCSFANSSFENALFANVSFSKGNFYSCNYFSGTSFFKSKFIDTKWHCGITNFSNSNFGTSCDFSKSIFATCNFNYAILYDDIRRDNSRTMKCYDSDDAIIRTTKKPDIAFFKGVTFYSPSGRKTFNYCYDSEFNIISSKINPAKVYYGNDEEKNQAINFGNAIGGIIPQKKDLVELIHFPYADSFDVK